MALQELLRKCKCKLKAFPRESPRDMSLSSTDAGILAGPVKTLLGKLLASPRNGEPLQTPWLGERAAERKVQTP